MDMKQFVAHIGGMLVSMAGTIAIVLFAGMVIAGKPDGKISRCPLAYVSRHSSVK
jgi:hypothetical protein